MKRFALLAALISATLFSLFMVGSAFGVVPGPTFTISNVTDRSLQVNLDPSLCQKTVRISVAVQQTDLTWSSDSKLTTVMGACASADTTPPSAPPNLRVSSASPTSLSFAWDASTDNVGVDHYSYSFDGGASSSTTALSASASGLACGTSHTFSVKAVDAAGNSSVATSGSGSTSPCADTSPPSAPPNLRVSASTQTSLSIAWDASTDNVGVDHYTYAFDGGIPSSTTSLNATASGLACGSAHTFSVQAVDAAGNFSPASTGSGSTAPCPDTTPPSAPPNLRVASATQTSISIAWDASSDNVGVDHYSYSFDGGAVATTTALNASKSGLTCGTSHTFSVQALDAAGNISTASTGSGSTSACPPPPPPASMANLWVDTNGGSCTRNALPAAYNDATACSSTTTAQTPAQSGDTVLFAPGTFPGQSVSKAFSAMTTFGCVAGAKLDVPAASDGAQSKGFSFASGASHVRLSNCELLDGVSVELSATTDFIEIVGNFIHSSVTPTASSTYAQLSSYGIVERMTKAGSHLTISGNHIKDIAYQCNGFGSNLSGCDTDDNSAGGGVSRGYCINDSASQILVVTGNHLDRCWEDGIQVHAVNFTFTDNDVNDVWNIPQAPGNHQDGIQIFTANPQTAKIERNRFHGQMDTCIRIQDVPHSGFVIRNNVCGQDPSTSPDGLQVHGNGLDLENLSNSIISFNTINSNPGSNVSQPDAPSSGNTVEDNIFLPARSGTGLSVTTTNTTVRNNIAPEYTGTPACVNCITTLPTFINIGAGDYRLAAGSVGINQGVAEAGVTTDVGGRPRPATAGTLPDIGGWERQSTDP